VNVTEPVGADQLPTPGIVTVNPVPLDSEILHDSVTFAVPPEMTDEGFAVNELIVGAGQGSTVTVADWLKEQEPFELTAVKV